MSTPTTPRKNPWPIFIVVWLALFFLFSIGLVVFASRQKMDLVRGDYYDEEIRYQEQLDRMNRTLPFAGDVSVSCPTNSPVISVALPAIHARQGVTGRINLYRPDNDLLDKEIKLAPDATGHQEIDAKTLQAGLWRVRVYWTSLGQGYYYGKDILVANPPKLAGL
jgi:hypothetical protein